MCASQSTSTPSLVSRALSLCLFLSLSLSVSLSVSLSHAHTHTHTHTVARTRARTSTNSPCARVHVKIISACVCARVCSDSVCMVDMVPVFAFLSVLRAYCVRIACVRVRACACWILLHGNRRRDSSTPYERADKAQYSASAANRAFASFARSYRVCLVKLCPMCRHPLVLHVFRQDG